MALTAIVFAIAFVVVQFSALAYSPRLVVMITSIPLCSIRWGLLCHVCLFAGGVMWTDHGGSGVVPHFSTLLVDGLLIVSMIAFAKTGSKSQQPADTQRPAGHRGRGRAVIRTMFVRMPDTEDAGAADALSMDLGPVSQTLTYSGEPRVVARFESHAGPPGRARRVVLELECGVGETLIEDTVLMRVQVRRGSCRNGAPAGRPPRELAEPSNRIQSMQSACWSILPSGHCRRPSTIRRPQCRRSIRSRTCCGASGAAAA